MRCLVAFFVLLGGIAGLVKADGPIPVSASIPPLAAIVRDVGGGLVDVRVVLPPGASPHGFAPTPEAVRALADAQVHFVVGRGLDLWAEDLARGANPRAVIERVAAGDLPGPEPAAAPHRHGSESQTGTDPHVWLDPRKAAAIAGRIGEVLIRLRPEQAETLRQSVVSTQERYRDIERICDEGLAPVREIPFVTQHGALNHFVARFRLHQVGVLEQFPGAEPSPRDLKKIIEEIRVSGARAVFSEPQSSPRLAEVIGQETGIRVVMVDPLGGVEGRMTYAQLVQSCLEAIVQGLSIASEEAR